MKTAMLTWGAALAALVLLTAWKPAALVGALLMQWMMITHG